MCSTRVQLQGQKAPSPIFGQGFTPDPSREAYNRTTLPGPSNWMEGDTSHHSVSIPNLSKIPQKAKASGINDTMWKCVDNTHIKLIV